MGNMALNSLSWSWDHAFRPHGAAGQVDRQAYALADFDGLYLYISAIGTKAWHFRYSWFGKRERITLGNYPALSLKDARAFRDEARSLFAKGVNPRSERKRGTRSSWPASTPSWPSTSNGWPIAGSRWRKDGRPAWGRSDASSRRTCFRRYDT
jgi:hypothetical protein